MVPWYAWAGIAWGGLAVVFMVAICAFVLFCEKQEEADTQKQVAKDEEVADLYAIWNMPVRVGSSLPMRPARHSRNRLHRGF